jgi:hypothetical protein
MSNSKKAWFHSFNDAGLTAKKSINDAIISGLVEAGKCKSGAILAYGSLSYYWTDNMINLAKKKRVRDSELWAAIECLKDEIERQERFISEHQ